MGSAIDAFVGTPKVRPAPNPATFNLNSVKDVPTLNNALKTGQINKDQYMQRLQQFTGQSKSTGPTANVSILHPSTLFPAVKAYGPGVAATTVADMSGERPAANVLARVLPGGQNDIKAENNATNASLKNLQYVNSLRNSGKISNQKASTLIQAIKQAQDTNAADIQATKQSIPSRGVAAASVGTGVANILTGGTLKGASKILPALGETSKIAKTARAVAQPVAFGTAGGLQAGASGGTKKQIIEQAALGAALPTALKGAANLPKALSTARVAAGKDNAVGSLINTTKAKTALDTARTANTADKLGGAAVKEANTTRIPVREPKTTQIPVEGKSTQVTGKVTANPDSKYTAASNKLSAQYEKDLAKVQSVPHPITQQVLQRQLDQKYQALQDNLDTKFGQTSVNFTGKSKTLGEATTQAKLPRSALDNQATPLEPQTSSVTGVADKTVQTTTKVPKATETTTTKPITQSIPNTGEKVSGSALNAESRAVQKGLVENLGDKATYSSGSYKREADKAVQLTNNDHETALKIATGAKPGDNTMHEVAVAKAVENKALKEGDVSTLTRLAQSPRHTATSEAAQRLGAEGFNTARNSPVQAIREISQAREKAVGKNVGTQVESTVKDIKSKVTPVKRQDWHNFIQSLQC